MTLPAAVRLAFLAVVLLVLAACGETISDKYVIIDEPVTLEEVAGSGLKKVTLTERATQRLGIATSPVTKRDEMLVVPSGALWMDVNGVFWVYTNPEPNVFLRHAVVVADDDGRRAELLSGPVPGTTVVSVGVPELFGAEVGVGK